MAIRTHILVVANQTLDHPDLIAALRDRASQAPIRVTLLAPVAWAERESAQQRLDTVLAKLREAEIPAEGLLGDQDPMVAVQEAWDPKQMDEVLVSTLAARHSRWIRSDLPQRLARYIDCPVRHLETTEPRERAAQPLPAKPRQPLLVGLLSNMHAETRREAGETS
jgi:nucleotide-binding universal stress UspA family protein